MFSVVEFDKQRECAIVPLTWLVEEQKTCLWPTNIRNEEIFQELVASQKAPMSGWRKYPVRKVHFLCATYKEATLFLNKLIEQDSSSNDTGSSRESMRVRKELINESPERSFELEKIQSSERQAKINLSCIVQESELSKSSKKTKVVEFSDDDFSSDDEETTKRSIVLNSTPQDESSVESLDTTITVGSTGHLYTPSRTSSSSSAVPSRQNVENNLVAVLLRRVERLIATQDQHSILLDNILRNQQLQSNNVIERPVDFPKLPISNKSEYRAVEEFLNDDDKYSYMKKRLSTIGGSSVRNMAMNMLKFLLSNQVAMKFNWSGKDKRPFKKTKICSAITEAIKLAYSGGAEGHSDVNDKVIKEAIQDWLKLSKARYTYSLQKK